MRGRRWIRLAVFASCALLVGACTQDVQGLRTPRSAASQSLGIRWQEGRSAGYRWTIDLDWQIYGDQPLKRTIAGSCQTTVVSVDGKHDALLQVTFWLDPQYVSAGQSGSFVFNLNVDPRGKVLSNPDGQFIDLLDLHNIFPLLPPAGAVAGDRWHESYSMPNPLMDDKRNFSVGGQYVRDEGSGLSRTVVIQAHLVAQVDDTADYQTLFGPPSKTDPPKVTIHDVGTEIADVTYWYDPIHQGLVKSVARNDLNVTRTFLDASNNRVFATSKEVGIETVTVTRSES